MEAGLPQTWGSGCDGRWRVTVIVSLEALPETGAERTIVNGAADLEQPVGAASRPPHLLLLVHPTVHCCLFIRRFTRKLAVPSVSAVPTRNPAWCRSA